MAAMLLSVGIIFNISDKENQSLKERIVGLEELVHKLKEIIKEKLPEIYKSIVQSKQKTKKRGLERIE